MSSAWVYPPLPTLAHQQQAEADALSRELQWYLSSLQQSLSALRHSLHACAGLLAPTGTGSTLALSTPRSECVKGYVTRVGTSVVKGDIHVRMPSLPPPAKAEGATRLIVASPTSSSAVPLQLRQLADVRRLISDCLDVVDVSTWTGDATDAAFISGQLKLLYDQLAEARKALEGEEEAKHGSQADDNEQDEARETLVATIRSTAWTEDSADPNSFDPPLPTNLSFHLTIRQAALVLCLRTLKPAAHNQASISDFLLLKSSFFGYKPPQQHDEVGQAFAFRGNRDEPVNVVEKVTVESQDPNLMSAMAKITSMENEVWRWRCALGALMGVEIDDD